MTTETIHTCSYSCERPGCIRAQRDELVARLTATQQQEQAAPMADIERLPCGVEHELRADAAIIRSWIDVANGPINREALADRLDRYANAAAELTAEIEALRAEVAEAREFRDKLAKAIGNEQLRMFIEKHGEPVPLTLRVQAAEARAERLAEALRLAEEHISALTPEWYSAGQRVLAEIRAALATNRQEPTT